MTRESGACDADGGCSGRIGCSGSEPRSGRCSVCAGLGLFRVRLFIEPHLKKLYIFNFTGRTCERTTLGNISITVFVLVI